jgi:hypothetical protein
VAWTVDLVTDDDIMRLPGVPGARVTVRIGQIRAPATAGP